MAQRLIRAIVLNTERILRRHSAPTCSSNPQICHCHADRRSLPSRRSAISRGGRPGVPQPSGSISVAEKTPPSLSPKTTRRNSAINFDDDFPPIFRAISYRRLPGPGSQLESCRLRDRLLQLQRWGIRRWQTLEHCTQLFIRRRRRLFRHNANSECVGRI